MYRDKAGRRRIAKDAHLYQDATIYITMQFDAEKKNSGAGYGTFKMRCGWCGEERSARRLKTINRHLAMHPCLPKCQIVRRTLI